MTKKELEQYENLNDKFYSACERYCEAMKEYDSDYGEIDTFVLCNGLVEGTGYNYHYEENYSVSFIDDNLLMNDEELSKYVADLIYKKNKKREEEEGIIARRKEEEERALYEKLKKRYG